MTALTEARLHVVALVLTLALFALAAAGTFLPDPFVSIAYVASLCTAALVVLLVAVAQDRQTRAWRLVGIGITIWAAAGFLVTLQQHAGFTGIPKLVVDLGYMIGYFPVIAGFAELADPTLRVRRLSTLADGVLLFLVFYGVLWMLVVEPVVFDTSQPRLDRAFSALYPAGDIAVLMLAVRVVASRAARRRVGALLLLGALLSAAADIALMAYYQVNPDGTFAASDLLYLSGLTLIAVAAVFSLLPAPPPVISSGAVARRLPVLVGASVILPALVLLGVELFSHRNVTVVPVAVWLAVTGAVMLARQLAGVRDLERAHQQAVWSASHDQPTGLLHRAAFLHQLAQGNVRQRSGTIIVVEVQGIRAIADHHGLDATQLLLVTLAARLRNSAGSEAILARFCDDQFVAFLRSVDVGRGTQVANAANAALRAPVNVAGTSIVADVVVGVAQADGAVIDATAGVRRATEAMRHARMLGGTVPSFDAELAGQVLSPVRPTAARPAAVRIATAGG